MSTGIPGLTKWQIELINANRHAPLEVQCDSDGEDKAYQEVFEEILDKDRWGKYDSKEDFQMGVIWDCVESLEPNQKIYSLLLSNSAEDAKKLNEALDIAWWIKAREESIRMIGDGSCNDFMGWHHNEPDDGYNDFEDDYYDRGFGYTGTRDPQSCYC